jgi:hypothetical protein
MKTAVGIFASRSDAELALHRLMAAGVPSSKINFLTPGNWEERIGDVPTSDTEQPGTAKAVGGVVGGAMGASAGFGLGPILAGLLVPGLGTITAIGFAAAALLGLGGAVGGAAAGAAMEETLSDGLPKDELFVYEDALRKGHSVVVALLDSEDEATRAKNILVRSGTESVDAAREDWWVGLRGAEQAEYERNGEPFTPVEGLYRRGFEAAHRTDCAGRSLAEASSSLRSNHPDCWNHPAFRRGYERGQTARERGRARDREPVPR